MRSKCQALLFQLIKNNALAEVSFLLKVENPVRLLFLACLFWRDSKMALEGCAEVRGMSVAYLICELFD